MLEPSQEIKDHVDQITSVRRLLLRTIDAVAMTGAVQQDSGEMTITYYPKGEGLSVIIWYPPGHETNQSPKIEIQESELIVDEWDLNLKCRALGTDDNYHLMGFGDLQILCADFRNLVRALTLYELNKLNGEYDDPDHEPQETDSIEADDVPDFAAGIVPMINSLNSAMTAFAGHENIARNLLEDVLADMATEGNVTLMTEKARKYRARCNLQ